MDLTGEVKEVVRDFRTRKPIVSFILDYEPNGIDRLQDKKLTIKVTTQKSGKKRSLDSNAYFHVLCDKIRQELRISMAACKNHLITDYGQIEYIDEGQALVYKTNASPEYIDELEGAHLKFIKRGADGAYWYKVYRGSHTYNVDEMRKLIEGTVDVARQLDIEVATPDELKRMAELWQQKNS